VEALKALEKRLTCLRTAGRAYVDIVGGRRDGCPQGIRGIMSVVVFPAVTVRAGSDGVLSVATGGEPSDGYGSLGGEVPFSLKNIFVGIHLTSSFHNAIRTARFA
jgi:hypothetical protein